jgi:hypothetical protein
MSNTLAPSRDAMTDAGHASMDDNIMTRAADNSAD